MSHTVHVVCAACGCGKPIEVDELPQFAVDVAIMAEASGFNYVFDMAYGRVVIFCSDRCKDANITTRGYLRRNIISPKDQA